MHTKSYPESLQHRLEIPSGACQQLALRVGATVICVSGSVRVEERAIGPEAAGGLPFTVAARVNAGEAHGVAYGGAVRVTALGAAQVICLDVSGPFGRALRGVAKIFRGNKAENTNIGLGALHKI
ncbi:hypothetical protein RAS12_13960 [Achromobacter seleniivolatilans]|uniref:Uncharacterized protein n=1 Tax=Achromobacter seleniivolatilans TaxID=3047478 RepID=A0ABY9M8X7_9BURK|nr:hypothetical protein [Achromobacter sp. R39]WMD23426.1 hypothetical protein RAS12_13960 [Achromobacter sp. R39]